MHFSTVLAIPAFAALAAALSVTSPTKGADVDFSEPTTVKWNSVSTDPEDFAIVLVDQTTYPPVKRTVATNVQTSEGSYTIPPQAGIDGGEGFQINLVSKKPNNKGILAQSQQFNVVGTASSSATGSSSSTTAPETTATATASTSASASASTTGPSSSSSPSSAQSQSQSTAENTASSASSTGSSSSSATDSASSASASNSATNSGTSGSSSGTGTSTSAASSSTSTETGGAAGLVGPASGSLGALLMGILVLGA